jgi:hypothetical protein
MLLRLVKNFVLDLPDAGRGGDRTDSSEILLGQGGLERAVAMSMGRRRGDLVGLGRDYHLANNEAGVTGGISHDTAEFAVATISHL